MIHMGETERIGVSKVQLIVNEDLGWAFREQNVEDYGIDAQIEVRGKSYLTGKILGVQIKSGESYFLERSNEKVIFRFDATHYNYWSNCPFQVILALYSPSTKKCIWEALDNSLITKTEKGNYKIGIYKTNYLNRDAKNRLLVLAYNNNIKALAFAAVDLFDSSQEIHSFYLELDENQKHIFEDGLKEFKEKNVTYNGFPLNVDENSAKIIAEVVKGFSDKHCVNEKSLMTEKFYYRKSFSDVYISTKSFLEQNDTNELLILGMAGIGKSTLVDKIHSTIQEKSILIRGAEFSSQVPETSTDFQHGHNLIIFDGWDEVPLKHKKEAKNFLKDIMLKKQNKVIITSRYFPDFLDEKIDTFEIAPLTDQEILEILKDNDLLPGTDKSNIKDILQNLRMFNTPLLLKQIITLNNYVNLSVENITFENILYATYMQYSCEQRDVLEKLAFDMFATHKVDIMLDKMETKKLKEYREIIVNEDKVSFMHESIYELFLAKKIFDKLFLRVESFEISAINTFSKGIPSVQTFEYIKIFISKCGISHKNIILINEKFTKMLESGIFGEPQNNVLFFQEISNVFYSIWHVVLYINKYFIGEYKFNNADRLEKNLVCLIDIFNKFYFGKKFLDFSNVNLENFKLWRCNAIDINFKNAILRYVNFRSSQLEGSNFENADMTKCQLVGANMQYANLKNAILEEANVARCMVSECSLPDILRYKKSLKGLDSLIINMGRGEYISFSQYKKLYS